MVVGRRRPYSHRPSRAARSWVAPPPRRKLEELKAKKEIDRWGSRNRTWHGQTALGELRAEICMGTTWGFDALCRRTVQVLSPRTLSPFYIENTSVHRKGV